MEDTCRVSLRDSGGGGETQKDVGDLLCPHLSCLPPGEAGATCWGSSDGQCYQGREESSGFTSRESRNEASYCTINGEQRTGIDAPPPPPPLI